MIYSRTTDLTKLPLSKRYRITLLAFMANLMSQMAIDLYTPSMPAMQLALATTETNIKLTLTMYMLGYGITQLFFGYLADKKGRRFTLMTGYIGFLIAILCLLHTQAIVWFIVWRFVQGCMGGAFQVCMRATYRDLFSGVELTKVSAYFSAIWSLLPILAPAVGGYIEHYFGWHMQFKVMLFFTGLFAIITWRLLPETRPASAEAEAKNFFSALKKTIVKRNFMLNTITVGFSAIPMMAFITVAPFLMQVNLKLTPVKYGWCMLLIGCFGFAGSLLSARLVKRIGHKPLMIIMLSLFFVSSLSFVISNALLIPQLVTVMLPMMIILFCGGAIYPLAAGPAYAAINNNTGVAVAVFGLTLLLMTAGAMAIVSVLPHYSALPLAILILVDFICLLGMWLMTQKICGLKT